jgi:hypothetical protein
MWVVGHPQLTRESNNLSNAIHGIVTCYFDDISTSFRNQIVKRYISSKTPKLLMLRKEMSIMPDNNTIYFHDPYHIPITIFDNTDTKNAQKNYLLTFPLGTFRLSTPPGIPHNTLNCPPAPPVTICIP